ncbi:MAG TPA: dimethylargininase [Polyangia bacterium]|jgi:dimethylargininase
MTRAVSPAIARCELTHLARTAIDVHQAGAQHRQYEEALRGLGCRVVSLPAEPDLPDSVFIEDAAVALDELAVITRPGAASRRGETAAVAAALAPLRPLAFIEEPGTLDGGDVLRLGQRLFVGHSGRSNESGVAQLRALVAPYGYTVTAVPVSGCLHLKSAVTQVGEDAVLVHPGWLDPAVLGPVAVVAVAPDEPHAANGLLVGGRLLYPASFPRTRARLESRGVTVVPVDVSELQKAEGAVTCCSLVFTTSA